MNNKISKDLSGNWDIPFPNHAQLLVKATIYKPAKNDKEEDVEIASRIINYGDYEHRKFLGRFSLYAWQNGFVVETVPLKKE